MEKGRWLFGLILTIVGLSISIPSVCKSQTGDSTAPVKPNPAAWEKEWNDTLAAARKEGKIMIYGPPGDTRKALLVDAFQKAYPGIEVELYSIASSSTLMSKLQSELQAEKYISDLWLHGCPTAWRELKPMGALDPILPNLILPEVKDVKAWRGINLEPNTYPLADKERTYVWALLVGASPCIAYNTQQVKAGEVQSWEDLLDVKWQGKLCMADPVASVAGQGTVGTMLWHLGEERCRSILTRMKAMNPVIAPSVEQLTEWVARGKYAVLWGCQFDVGRAFIAQGLPVGITDVKGSGKLSSGKEGMAIFRNRPHPNATKIYVNWLLTKEVQRKFALIVGNPSCRVDVSTEGLPSESIPMQGVKYHSFVDENFDSVTQKAMQIAKEIFKK